MTIYFVCYILKKQHNQWS